MDSLLLPTHLEIIPDKDPNKATLIIEPCYPGYGTTIGNALRRVLLSSLPGAAVVGVKIEGADHEFSTLPGVREDVVQIVLNLKQVRLKVFSAETVRLNLEVSGERAVTAADIKPNSDVEIIRGDLPIATLTDKDATLKMEILVRQGRGYIPVEEREDEAKEIGVIQIDSVFTPIRSVGYRVEDVRVGQKTNFDRLTMQVESDGTIYPQEAIQQSARILLDYFNLVSGVEKGKKKIKKEKQAEEDAQATSEQTAEDENPKAVEE